MRVLCFYMRHSASEKNVTKMQFISKRFIEIMTQLHPNYLILVIRSLPFSQSFFGLIANQFNVTLTPNSLRQVNTIDVSIRWHDECHKTISIQTNLSPLLNSCPSFAICFVYHRCHCSYISSRSAILLFYATQCHTNVNKQIAFIVPCFILFYFLPHLVSLTHSFSRTHSPV